MNTFNVALLFAILSISIPSTAFALENNVFMYTYELNVKELQKLSTHTIETSTPWRESRTYKGYFLSDILSLLDFHSDDLQLWSYGHLWCMGNWGRWRILLIDFVQDFNNREMIRHDQVYPTGVA